jgi:tartrate-resistant acid phosphatase type 5
MNKRSNVSWLLVVLLALAPAAHCQTAAAQKTEPVPVGLSEVIVNRLPPNYREEARKELKLTDDQQQSLAKQTDENLTSSIVRQLAYKPEASDFVLAELEREPSPKLRSTIITSLGQYWQAHPESQTVLERHASSDADADVALKALDELRTVRMQGLGKLLATRLEEAKKSGDSSAAAKLAKEQERHYQWYGELNLPNFLQLPPPPFSLKPENQPIRVLAFGDFGTGSPEQLNLAKAMVNYHKSQPFDFGLTLGDNFYTYGMVSPSDPRWQTQWERLYAPLGIKFYPTFGNHDYGQPDSPAAEILYSDKSPDWRFPAPYYTFTAGPVQFFAIDNVNLSEAELLWLDSELAKSHAPWKVVYGHYHIYSATRGDNKELVERLLPVLKKNHVEVYLNGHDHNLQEVKPEGGVHFFVSGGGGAELYDLKPYDKSVFKQKVNGFTVLEANAKYFNVSFVGMDGKEIYSQKLEKGAEGASLRRSKITRPGALDADLICAMAFGSDGDSGRMSRESSACSAQFFLCGGGEGCGSVYRVW